MSTTQHIAKHASHVKAHLGKLHIKHADKVVKISKRSRLWLEIVTLGGTAWETRLVVLAIASIAWIIVDVTLMLVAGAEEL